MTKYHPSAIYEAQLNAASMSMLDWIPVRILAKRVVVQDASGYPHECYIWRGRTLYGKAKKPSDLLP